MKKIYYTPKFDVALFPNSYAHGKEGWIDDPHSLRNHLMFLEGIAENVLMVKKCDPIKLEYIDGYYRVGKGGAGGNRLQAMMRVLNLLHVPALITVPEGFTPNFDVVPVTTEAELNSYYRIGSAKFDDDGDYTYIPWSWDANTIKKTFIATPKTNHRMYLLFRLEELKMNNQYEDFHALLKSYDYEEHRQHVETTLEELQCF